MCVRVINLTLACTNFSNFGVLHIECVTTTCIVYRDRAPFVDRKLLNEREKRYLSIERFISKSACQKPRKCSENEIGRFILSHKVEMKSASS